MPETIRLLLADDHALIRQLLTERLNAQPDMVVESVSSAEECLEKARRFRPDVVVLDVDMPGLTSFSAAKMLATIAADARIVFLSRYVTDTYIEQALSVGARAYISKEESFEAILAAIRVIASGGTYWSPQVQERILVGPKGLTCPTASTRLASLSDREQEVLSYIAQAMAAKQIAATMHLSVKTVNAHTANLMAKLEIRDRVALTRFAIREGLVNP